MKNGNGRNKFQNVTLLLISTLSGQPKNSKFLGENEHPLMLALFYQNSIAGPFIITENLVADK